MTSLFCPHRYQRDGELSPPGDGELRPDQTLDSHDDIFHRLLHVPKNPTGRSTDQHLLCCGRGTALNLWETLQVGDNKLEIHWVHFKARGVWSWFWMQTLQKYSLNY